MKITFLRIVFYRVIAIALVATFFYVVNQYEPAYNLAASFAKLKIGFMTGFLTVAGFLLTGEHSVLTKAFNIFDSKNYRIHFNRQKRINPKLKDIDLLDPLDNSNNLISATILCSLSSSVIHIVLALFEHQEFIIALSFGFTFVTFYSVIKVLFITKNIHTRWIDNMRNQSPEGVQ